MARKIFFAVSVVIFLWCAIPAFTQQAAAPKLNVLDQSGWQAITSRGNYLPVQMDLLLLRANPSVLDDPTFMKYFILLNQCGSSPADQMRVLHGLSSEFEYPEMVTFYKPKVADVAKVAPDTFALLMAAPYGSDGHYQLGDWDPARKSFPFVDPLNKPVTVKFDSVFPGGSRDCTTRLQFPTAPVYRVQFPEQKFTEIQMPEEAARNYALKHGKIRHVTALVEVQVLPDPPQIQKKDPRTGDKQIYVTFRGKINKVTIITDDSFRQELGVINP